MSSRSACDVWVMWTKRALLSAFGRMCRRSPWLTKLGRAMKLGRLFAAGDMGRLVLDGDVQVDFDLSVRDFRYLYFMTDLASSPEFNLLKRLQNPEGIFIDIGASTGFISLVAAKYYKHVFAIEPGFSNLRYLRHNLNLNPNLSKKITVLPFALDKCQKAGSLYFDSDRPLIASLAPIEGSVTRSENVQCRTLDSIFSKYKDVTLIKIDTEGSEYNILLGSVYTIKNNRPFVICEISDVMQRRFQNKASDIYDYFADLNYICVLSPYNRDLILNRDRFNERASQAGGPFNVLFSPRESLIDPV